MPRFVILDPLTLTGQELVTEISKQYPEAGLTFFHTADDDEHQISDIGGQPALIPPLGDDASLSDFDAVILAADRISPRLKFLENTLEANGGFVFIDASALGHYRHLTRPTLNTEGVQQGARLRPPHPSIVVADKILQALAPFKPAALTIASIEPVSIYGKEAVTALAQQAAQRLQGDAVSKKIDKHIVAFNLTAVSGSDLSTEASELFPGLEVVAARTLGGCFHGHLAIFGLTFAEPVSNTAIVRALKKAPDISIKKAPLDIDGLNDRDGICLTPPEVSSGGRSVSLQAMVDGLHFGGAKTVATLLEGVGEG